MHIYSYPDEHGDRHTICDRCKGNESMNLDWSNPLEVPTDYALCEICRKKMKSDRILRQGKISLSISVSIDKAEELKAAADAAAMTLSEYILRKL